MNRTSPASVPEPRFCWQPEYVGAREYWQTFPVLGIWNCRCELDKHLMHAQCMPNTCKEWRGAHLREQTLRKTARTFTDSKSHHLRGSFQSYNKSPCWRSGMSQIWPKNWPSSLQKNETPYYTFSYSIIECNFFSPFQVQSLGVNYWCIYFDACPVISCQESHDE